MVLALVVLLVGTMAVCGLQPGTAVELPRRGAQEIRSCDCPSSASGPAGGPVPTR
jgi:hypothetical protein